MTQFRSSAWMRIVSLALAGLMMTGVVGVGGAWAEHNLLFPFWAANAPNVTTFVTVINPNYTSGAPVHYQYHFKAVTAANTAACDAYSTFGESSQNDILTYDVSGFLSREPLLFDDTSGSNGGLGLNVFLAVPSMGYLVVENSGGDQPSYGEAFVVDVANGGTWGYNAISILTDDNATQIGGFQALLTGTRRPVHLLPSAVATEAFIVTPLGAAMRTNSANRTALQLQLEDGTGGVYDRNENKLDFTVRPGVQCVGILGYADLIHPSVLLNPVWSQQGGWAWLANVVVGDSNRNAVVFKRIHSTVFGPFVLDAQPVVQGVPCATPSCIP